MMDTPDFVSHTRASQAASQLVIRDLAIDVPVIKTPYHADHADHADAKQSYRRLWDGVHQDWGIGVHVIMGSNGVGKSTLLRVLAGVQAPTRGTVTWDNVALRAGDVWWMPQNPLTMPWLSVLDNVLLPWRLSGSVINPQRVREALQRTGLDALSSRLSRYLSSGERQRIALARAVLSDAPVLLLDEPFTAIDMPTRRMLMSVFTDLARTRCIIWVTHNPYEAFLVADTVALALIPKPRSPTQMINIPSPFELTQTTKDLATKNLATQDLTDLTAKNLGMSARDQWVDAVIQRMYDAPVTPDSQTTEAAFVPRDPLDPVDPADLLFASRLSSQTSSDQLKSEIKMPKARASKTPPHTFTPKLPNRSHRFSRITSFARDVLKVTLMVLVVLGGWEAIVRLTELPLFILPPPSVVIDVLVSDLSIFVAHAAVTMTHIVVGVMASVVVSFVVSVSMALGLPVRRILLPWILTLQVVPVFVFAPLLVLYLGYGMVSKIFMAVIMMSLPLTLAMFQALQKSSQALLPILFSWRARRMRAFLMVRLPVALPAMIIGFRQTVQIAPLASIIGEWVGSTEGLGYMMLQAGGRLETERVFAAMLILIVLTLLLVYAVEALTERFFVRWHQDDVHAG